MIRMGRIIAVALLLATLCGCGSGDDRGYTLPKGEPIPGYEGGFYKPVFTTIEDYEQFLSKSYIPEGYVSYRDISFIGEFNEYRLMTDEDLYGLHNGAYYVIKDISGCRVIVSISKYSSLFAGTFEADAENMETNGIDDLRYVSEYPPDDAEHASYRKIYKIGDVRYTYQSVGRDSKLALKNIDWKYGEYYVTILRGDTTVLEYNEAGRPGATLIEFLNTYPEDAKDTFVGRLLNPETARGAVNQLNFVIWWCSFRDGLTKWLPVIIPVVCVAAAGTVYLIIRRKRKKAATKAAQENESKTEE